MLWPLPMKHMFLYTFQVYQIFLDNSFPVLLLQHKAAIRCLDLSARWVYLNYYWMSLAKPEGIEPDFLQLCSYLLHCNFWRVVCEQQFHLTDLLKHWRLTTCVYDCLVCCWANVGWPCMVMGCSTDVFLALQMLFLCVYWIISHISINQPLPLYPLLEVLVTRIRTIII